MAAFPILINGVNYSWIDITFILFGVPVAGITEINYKTTQKKDNNYGAGAFPVSRGYGQYDYEADITLYTDEWRRIIAASPNRDPLQIAPFSIPIIYGSSRVVAQKDVLTYVEFTENPLATKQGDTKILVKIPLIFAGLEQ